MHPLATIPKEKSSYQEKRRVTLVGALINLLLAISKVIVGFIGSSQALIADGLHSLSDLASDFTVLVVIKYGSQEADSDHPYGHARFETAATMSLGLLLLIVAGGITVDAVRRLFSPELLLQPGPLALSAAVLSILAKEGLFHYTMQVARRIRSNLLRANAWHHRSDAISSIVVFVGIAGTMAGLPYLDAIGAVGVALMIAKIGWDLGREGLRELVDTGLNTQELDAINKTIQSVNGVKSHHMLRTRRMGEDVLVEVHIVVGAQVTVSEGHQISDRVQMKLKEAHSTIAEVLVHIDPEDDEPVSTTIDLPPREEVLRRLEVCWESMEAAESIEQVNLHYLEGKINVELVLPLLIANNLQDARHISSRFAKLAESEDEIGNVIVFFR